MKMGTAEVSGIYLGLAKVSKVMLGSVEVWSAYDADAQAYVSAVETSLGTTISNTRRSAIGVFVAGEKASGRWASLKRLYFPIWGQAAANAICLKSLTSGSFVGGVTHSAGYIFGNGTNGYFDTVTPLTTLGLTPGNAWHGRLFSNTYAFPVGQEGAYPTGATTTFALFVYTGGLFTELCGFSGGPGRTITALSNFGGIMSMHYNGGVFRQFQRTSSGRTTLAAITRAAVGTMPTIPAYEMARNQNPTAGQFSQKPRGASWYGTAVSDADDASFTLALKTLWETCTGLSLP